MKLNTYRGGIKPYEEIRPSINPKSDLLIEPQNTRQTNEPSSDEIGVAKTIDEIFLDVEKQNLSYYDEIEMISERLLQLETITFHGVLDIPYMLSPSSDYEDKATLIGGGGKAVKKRLEDLLTTIKQERSKKEKIIEQITLNNTDQMNDLYATFVEVSKNILTLTKEYNTLIDKNKHIVTNEKLEEDKIIAKLEDTSYPKLTKERCDYLIDPLIDSIKKSRDEYTENRNSILVDYENSANMRFHDREVSNLIFEVKQLHEKINTPSESLLKEPEYIKLTEEDKRITTLINDKINELRQITVQKASKTFIQNVTWFKSLQPANQFTITNEDCDKIINAATKSQLNLDLDLKKDTSKMKEAERAALVQKAAQAQKVAGIKILNVWKKNLSEIIELQKIMYLKGYSTNKEALADLQKYHEGVDNIDINALMLRFRNAFIERQGGYFIKFRYKEGKNVDTDPCHMFFFYSLRDETPRIPQEMSGDFHLTIHLGGEQAPEAPGTSAAHALMLPEPQPATLKMDDYDFTEGKIHLRKSSKEHTNKANLRPHIFKKRDTSFIGKEECMQLIPLYQPNANPTETVIYIGRVVTKVLNDYLQTLHIHSLDPKEIEDKLLIDRLSVLLSNEQNRDIKPRLETIIEEFEEDIQEKFRVVLRDIMLNYCLEYNNNSTDNSIKNLYIKMINFIKYEKTKEEKRIILEINEEELRNRIAGLRDEINNRLTNLRGLAQEVEETTTEMITRLAREAKQSRLYTRRASWEAKKIQTAKPEASKVELEPSLANETEASINAGKKKRKMKYTKKRHAKVSRKRHAKVSRKRHTKQLINN